MLNAFGIVLNQLAGTFQNIFDGAHSFKLPQGLSARAAVFSTALALKGFTGVRDPLLSKYGYFTLYCKTYQLEILTKDLGKVFYADYTCKPYPCCRSNHAAIDCALDLACANTINPENIDEIHVNVTPSTLEFAVGQPFKIRDIPQIDAAFNLQYTVACAISRKSVKLEHFTDEFIRDPVINNLISKIRLSTSIPPDKPLAALVKIKMKEGYEYEKYVDMPKGNGILTPLSAIDMRRKFFDNAEFSKAIPLDRAEKALNLLERIEEVDNIDKIVRLLTASR